jgi:hypothetical protein
MSLVDKFRNKLAFYGEGFLASRQTPKLEDHPLLFVRGCLLNIFAATLHYWSQSLLSQPDDGPCCGEKGMHLICMDLLYITANVVTGIYDRWQHHQAHQLHFCILSLVSNEGKEIWSVLDLLHQNSHWWSSIISSTCWLNLKRRVKTNSVALSPQVNYTDWATATCRRNLVPTFVDRRVSHGQRGRSPKVVNLSFLERSHYFSFK